MCGRYTLFADLTELGERFGFDADGLPLSPNYNIAPTQIVLAVTNGDGRHAAQMRWGLVPSWTKSLPSSRPMINARAETVAERPAFRSAFRRRRCLVIADGYYEWQRAGSGRTPFRIAMESGEPFAFAGLWETWQNPEGELVKSCAIITTDASEALNPIHDRMPVILPREHEELWLDHEVQDPGVLSDILIPHKVGGLVAYQVPSLVNSVRNNGPELVSRAMAG